MNDAISITATEPCGYTKYVVSTYGRYKEIGVAELVYGSDGLWCLFFSETFRRIHGLPFTAASGRRATTGRELLCWYFNPDLVANASVYAHAFSRSIDA